jgi:site-specific recombinase XerD
MKLNDKSLEISRHISTFINIYLPSQKTHSSHTIKAYKDALGLYMDFLEKEKHIKSINLCIDCFCSSNIEEWLIWLMETRLCSPETCNNRLSSIRGFIKYLVKKDISCLDLYHSVSLIKRKAINSRKISGMSKNAIKALLNAPDTSTKTGRRDLALMTVMYSTAARIDEILSMKVNQIHLEEIKPNITVIGKRGKVRTLYLLPKPTAHLKAYLKEAHSSEPDQNAFVFYSRNSGPSGKMSQNAVNKQLRKHAQSARVLCSEVPAEIHAHQLRHAKASHWLEDGMNIVQISFLLGHSQLQTTMVYLDILRVKRIFHFHPEIRMSLISSGDVTCRPFYCCQQE